MSEDDGGTSRRAYLRAVGAATVLAGTGAVGTARRTRTQGPGIEASESRIEMTNGSLAAALDRSDVEGTNSQVLCTSLGPESGTNTSGPHASHLQSPVSRTESPGARFRELAGYGVARSDPGAVAYGTVAEYELPGDSASDSRPVEVRRVVTLQEEDPFVLVDLRVENTGSTPVRIDQDDADVHDGLMLHARLSLNEPSGEYGFHLGNGTGARFERSSTWSVLGEARWGTLYDSETALTTVFIDGSTGPKMWITAGRPPDGLDFLVGEVTLEPGDAVTYRTALAVHESGSNPADSAADVVSAVRSRAEATNRTFAGPEDLELSSGTDPDEEGANSDADGFPVFRRFSGTPAFPVGVLLGAGVLAAAGYRYFHGDDESSGVPESGTGDSRWDDGPGGGAGRPGDTRDTEADAGGRPDREQYQADLHRRPPPHDGRAGTDPDHRPDDHRGGQE